MDIVWQQDSACLVFNFLCLRGLKKQLVVGGFILFRIRGV